PTARQAGIQIPFDQLVERRKEHGAFPSVDKECQRILSGSPEVFKRPTRAKHSGPLVGAFRMPMTGQAFLQGWLFHPIHNRPLSPGRLAISSGGEMRVRNTERFMAPLNKRLREWLSRQATLRKTTSGMSQADVTGQRVVTLIHDDWRSAEQNAKLPLEV